MQSCPANSPGQGGHPERDSPYQHPHRWNHLGLADHHPADIDRHADRLDTAAGKANTARIRPNETRKRAEDEASVRWRRWPPVQRSCCPPARPGPEPLSPYVRSLGCRGEPSGEPGLDVVHKIDPGCGEPVSWVGLGGLEPPASSLSGCRPHLLELGTGGSAVVRMSPECSRLSVMVGWFWHGSGTPMSRRP